MKNIKFAVLACGVLGLIACFLPMVSMGDMKITLWDAHKGPDGVQTYLVMAGYALAAVMGAMGIAKGLKRPQAIAAAAGFAFVLFKFRDGLSHMMKMAIGGKLLFIAAVAGLIVSVIAAAKPEDGQ